MECPQCRARNSLKRDTCSRCGFNIKKAANKVYWVDYWDQNRRRRRERIGASKAAAEARWAEIRKAKVEGRYVPSKREGLILFSEFWEKHYIPFCAEHNRPKWLERKQDVYRVYLREFFGSLPLRDITTYKIEIYKRKRLDQGAAPATVNRGLAILKHAFSQAVLWGLCKENPVKAVKMLSEDRERWRFLTKEEAQRLLENLWPETRPIFEFLLATGLRRGNVLNLRWDQVDLKNRTLRIPSSSSKGGKELVLPLSDWAMEILTRIPRHISSPYVFCKPSGEPWKAISKGFKSALKRAGLDPSIRIHDLRHTYASWAIQAGVDLALLKELLGHSTLAMVLRYAHLDQTSKLEAANKIKPPSAPADRHLYGHQARKDT